MKEKNLVKLIKGLRQVDEFSHGFIMVKIKDGTPVCFESIKTVDRPKKIMLT